MKVICNRGTLLEALTVAGNVVAARTTKPVLQCVKLSAEKNQLVLSATDLEVAIRYCDAQVEVQTTGEILVQADKLRDIVRESSDDTLSMELVSDHVLVRGNDSLFKIPTQPVETFPPISGEDGESDFEVPGAQFKKLIAQTVFAAAKTSTRYAYNGVLVVAKGKTITMVSTDGHRLAQSKGELTKAAKGEKEGLRAIVPTKTMMLIDRLIENPEEAVGVKIKENQIIIHAPSATLTSNLVEGQFPPYEDVIPRDTDKKMTSNTAEFLSAIRRAALVTTEESKGVRLKFTKSGLVLSSQSPVAGESTVNLPCKYEGSDFEIGFNPVYMTDAIRVVDTDEISLEMTAANRPGLLRAGTNFLCVVMPVNLQ